MARDEKRRAAARLKVALDLFEFGEALFRLNLRRSHPGIKKAEIDRKVREWLRTRPGAEFGDAPGKRIPLPR